MAHYILLGYAPAPGDAADVPVEVMEAYGRYDELVRAAGGRIVGGYALDSSVTATSIRGDDITDGPFIEAKEVLAGIQIIEADDLDHALTLARLHPATRWGGMEVRPLLE